VPLTFEHVPPASAFNREPVPGVSAADYQSYVDGSFTPQMYLEGMGHYSLCDQCNQRTGAKYVEELAKGAKALWPVLQSLAVPISPYKMKFVAVELGPIFPLRYLKQMVTMLLAINGEEFALANPELGDFVRLRDKRDLPGHYRMYLSAFSGAVGREVPADAVHPFDHKTGKTYQVTELAYPPFVYSMTVNDPRPAISIGSITHFIGYEYGQEIRSLAVRLMVDSGREGLLPIAARRLDPEQVAEVERDLPLPHGSGNGPHQ